MNRRSFLGATLVAAAGGMARLARRPRPAAAPPPTVASDPRSATAHRRGRAEPILGPPGRRRGTPEHGTPHLEEVGHVHGLMHEGDGRVASLDEAILTEPSPRRGYVALAATAPSAIA